MPQSPIVPLSCEQQLTLLQSRGMTILEPEAALTRLRQINYARLKGYLLPFRDETSSENYLPGTTFERVYRLYVFDSRLRGLLFPVLSEVELTMRSNLSAFLSQWYGAFGYLDPGNFSDPGEHRRFLRAVNIAAGDRDNASFLEGHRKQDGKYAVWVVTELLSMGGLAHLIANLRPADRKAFSREYYRLREDVMTDWADHFSLLRNAVAHYCRLYYAPFASAPATPRWAPFVLERDLFDYLFVTREFYLHPARWNESFLEPLRALLAEYEADVVLAHIGFPSNWYELLAK